MTFTSFLALATSTAAVVTPLRSVSPLRPAPCAALRSSHPRMKDWSRRATLAEKAGGAGDLGASAVGLTGSIPVEFTQGNETLRTMATVGQPLSAVAAQAGQFIKYKCRKGECGTCAVRVDGQWIRTCSVTVPHLPDGEAYQVFVRPTMVKGKKSSRFFSVRSFFDGFKNNILGMVGFVKEGPLSRKGRENFNQRISAEQELLERAKARKAAREAAKAAGLSLEDYEERLRAELARGEAEATTKAARK